MISPPISFYTLTPDSIRQTLLRHRFISTALVASVLAAIYWLLIASDRYVSEAHIIVQRTDLPEGTGITSLLGGDLSGSRADQLLLQDHLLSIDMLKQLDATLDLRTHYSDWRRDPLSRMLFTDTPIELFHRHYRSRVSVVFDDYSGVLIIKTQAYEPEKATAIAKMLVQEGERFMNGLAHRLAQAQVTFLEEQVSRLYDRAIKARQAVLDYQNTRGLASPQAYAESIAAIVAKLEAQRSELEIQRSALQAYLVANHAKITQINQQIVAVDQQIDQEQAKLAASEGKALNQAIEAFQRLETTAVFAQDVYKTALLALEKGRVEATRTIKKVSILQAPTEPEYPLEPRRLYNTLVFTLLALLLAGVVHLLEAIIRDHQD